MSQIVEINGRLVVFGLEWQYILDPNAERREIAKMARELMAKRSIILRQKDVACGFLVDEPPGGGKQMVYSAAAIFATHAKTKLGVLIYDLGDNMVALIAVRDGLPVPMMDVVGSLEFVGQRAQEFIQNAGEQGVVMFSNMTLAEDSQPWDFDQLPEWGIAAYLVQKVRSQALERLTLFVIIFMLMGGGYWYMTARQKPKAPPPAPPVDPVVQYRQSLAASLGDSFRFPAPQTAAKYFETIDILNIHIDGWKLAEVVCEGGQCSVTWERLVGGTNRRFAQASGADIESLSFSLDGKRLTQQIHVFDPQGTAVDPRSFPVGKQFNLDTGSLFQWFTMAGLSYVFEAPQIFGVKPGGQAPNAGSGEVVSRGVWHLTGNYCYAGDAASMLPAGNMTLDTLHAVFGKEPSDIKFTADGYYYVR